VHEDGDEGVLEPPHSVPLVWRDAVRHRRAVMTLARQLAFKETGEVTANEIAAHFKEHRARLIAEAEKMIATRAGFARWRFRR
jgi:galactose-1-phosphate uridylyltransferase